MLPKHSFGVGWCVTHARGLVVPGAGPRCSVLRNPALQLGCICHVPPSGWAVGVPPRVDHYMRECSAR